MAKVYKSPRDVDLLVGLLLEQKYGTYAGPVGTYLLEEQFYRFKYGNRFFYSHKNNPHPFTPGTCWFYIFFVVISFVFVFFFSRTNFGN